MNTCAGYIAMNTYAYYVLRRNVPCDIHFNDVYFSAESICYFSKLISHNISSLKFACLSSSVWKHPQAMLSF